MRLLFLVNAFVDDGPTGAAFRLAEEGRRHGHEVLAAALQRSGPRAAAWSELSGGAAQVLGWGPGPMAAWTGGRELRGLIARWQPEVIVAILAAPTLALLGLRQPLENIRTVIIHHGAHEWDERGPWVGRWVRNAMRRNLGRADVHLAVSPFTAQELQARLGQELRVEVLGNPLPPSPPVCTGTWEVSEVPLIGGCGRLVPLKNWKTLIKAVGILHRMGVHVRLEIVGEGPERESLKRLAVGLGIGDRVELPGNDPDWIARAQRWLAYVQPSEYESFGIAAAEAAQVGLPVLHPETGALGWTLGEAGQTYGQPKDSEGLATAILKILSEAEHESTEVLTQRRRQRQELMVARHGAEAVWDRFVRLALEKKASS